MTFCATAEAALALGLGATIAYRLASVGFAAEAAALALLCAAACGLEYLRGGAPLASRAGCSMRPDAGAGLAVGASSPALVVAALVVARGSSPLLRTYLWAAAAGGAQPLLAAAWCDGPLLRGAPALASALLVAVVPPLVVVGPTAAAICAAVAALSQLLAVGAFAAVQRCFTAGEGAMMALMSALLIVDAAVVTSCTVADGGPALCVARGEAATASEAVACGGLLLALLLLALCGPPRPAATGWRAVRFAALALTFTGGVLAPWLGLLVGAEPIGWVVRFFVQPTRLAIAAGWVAAIVVVSALAARVAPAVVHPTAGGDGEAGGADGSDGAGAAATKARRQRARLLLTRKLYHFLAVALFVPAALLERDFLQLCMAGALAVFLLLEAVRVCGVAPLAAPLGGFVRRFVDARDGGTLVLTHVYLLLGCALPVLLDAALPAPSARDAVGRAAAPLAGVTVLGVGDAMASAVGIAAGRTRWPGTRKTVEGTAAGWASCMLLLAALLLPHHPLSAEARGWAGVAAATALVCVLEAVTTQIDNLLLPPVYFAALLAAGPLALDSQTS